jgi:hypothetical protein
LIARLERIGDKQRALRSGDAGAVSIHRGRWPPRSRVGWFC